LVCNFLNFPNLTWLTGIIGKGFAAFLKQGSYQQKLSEKIVEIERVSTRFKYISMGCMQREVFSTSKTVTSLAVASGNNHLILKNTVDQTNQSLERLSLGETKQHEATQQMLGAEFKAWKIRYDDQLELNQKAADVLNDCKILLESIYVALPLCFQSKEPVQIPEIEYHGQHFTDSKSPPPYESSPGVQAG
jgi:hypothetical protein